MLSPHSKEQSAASPGLYRQMGKPLLDTILAITGLIVTLPLFVFCSIAITLSNRGPVFFRQERVGQFGVPFWIFKFRTMTDSQDGPRVTAAGDPRITRLGKWLRRFKIDEIPQLLNVLRGEMSFVGPRPEVPEYVSVYTPRQRNVLQVRPGITGPASLEVAHEEEILAQFRDQHNFYVNTLMPYKLELDLAYCNKISFSRDLGLICLTLTRLLSPHNNLSTRSWSTTNSKTG